MSYNPFASDQSNEAYYEDERRLLGDDDPKSHGYGDRMLETGDQRRKEARENASATAALRNPETRCEERWIWRSDNSSRCILEQGHSGGHHFIAGRTT